jgi:hypothetical protein
MGRKMKIIFMLRSGVIEWEVPPDLNPPFHFPSMATTIRCQGYFIADNLYIRHEELIGISVAGEGPIIKGTLQ